MINTSADSLRKERKCASSSKIANKTEANAAVKPKMAERMGAN
ncbi:hypothetical protein LEP1GSC192_3841 [Leptospira sp. B5-022]|nr:hypothetical protein LEP1GSC192_3841 [Leptospira sp. B5-022]